MAIQKDGHQTLIDIAGATLFEQEVTPPSIEGGGAVEQTTMRNTVWRTKCPKSLKTMGDSGFTAAYDPAAYTTIAAAINVNQAITITFPDLSTLVFWGWLDSFTPNASVEGEQPTAECTIIPSNVDGAGAEIAPVYAVAP